MIVVAGIIPPLDADRAKNPYRVEEIYKGLNSLDDVLANAGTITVPQRRAFVIIGGKNSMCTDLGGWNNRKIKFVAQAGTMHVAASRGGNMYASASRFLEESTKIGFAAAISPLGVAAGYNTVTQGGSFGTRYLAGLKTAGRVFTNPRMVINHGSSVARTWTVVQLLGGNKQRPDEIASLQSNNIYINDLFNLLLDGGIIRYGRNCGKGGGAVNYFGDEEDDGL